MHIHHNFIPSVSNQLALELPPDASDMGLHLQPPFAPQSPLPVRLCSSMIYLQLMGNADQSLASAGGKDHLAWCISLTKEGQ